MKADRAHFTHLYTAQEAAKSGLPAPVSPGPAHQAPVHTDPSLSEHRAGSLSSKLCLPPPYESDVQAAILELLDHHPRVAWAHRMNTGGVEREDDEGKKRFIKFAFKGCSDILGQLVDGRFLAIEVKRKGKNPTDDQRAFLERVNAHRGMAFVARSVDDVTSMLARLP